MYRLFLLVTALFTPAISVAGQTGQCQPPIPVPQRPNIFSEAQEADLGDAIAEHILRDLRVIDDEDVTGYLSLIGGRIVKRLEPTGLRFQFLIVDIPDANAFVLPGGRIYVSRKLIAQAQTEDELAGVLGHEVGHVAARQGSIQMTRLFREVLGVTEVRDRRDVFEKYNQLVENAARRPRAGGKDETEKEQLVADQIGLFAVARAGYDPESFARFWDRFTETKGKTGSFFSDLFGTTKPESKRLREMLKALATLPASCIERRAASTTDEYKNWQSSVINYTGLGRREVLHGVLRKSLLDPPLRGEITHLRFSPDGKFLVAQDDAGINVLSREPFAPLFRINAPEAKPASFTPDSQNIAFHNSDLRIELWSVAGQNLKTVHELFTRKQRCLQTALSVDAKSLACLDMQFNLNLFEVASGNPIFQKKDFYTPDFFALLMRLLSRFNSDESDSSDFELINMGFSPDGRYFAAGARSNYFGAFGLSTETTAIAVDLTTRSPVNLRGPLKKLISGGFTFFGPDRIVGVDVREPKKSAMVSFPAGEVLSELPLGPVKLAPAGRGNYLLVRPIAKYPVGVMDISTKTIFKANKQAALDLYDQVFVSERRNGELGLYGVEKNDVIATVLLPRNPLGRLRAAALSSDQKWLAVSERTRGAVWNLAKGERLFHVRGFSGAYFGHDGVLYADFPKLEEAERTIARLDMATKEIEGGPDLVEDRASQHGPFVLVTRPAKKDGGYSENVVIEVQDARTLKALWSKSYPKEAPQVWMSASTIALAWPVSANAAKAEISSDPLLARQLAAMKEKEGDYFLQVLDARSGEPRGRLLIETGKGSFRISNVFTSGDWAVFTDTENRTLLYSLSTGEQKGRVFGRRAAISPATGLLCVENEDGQLTLYDLASMDKRDQFTFSNAVELARFSADGKTLFVLSANQTVYLLDVSALSRK